MKHLATILLALFVAAYGAAQETGAKSVSLLTCEPSNEQIYTAWGHTALRVCDPESGMDVVFNYGIFSFDDLGKFIYKFVKGETDYKLGTNTYQRSLREAVRKNAYLYEQKLNLTAGESEKVCDALFENAKPENCYYRYNFFYDNCATRPRAIIENAVEGSVAYPETPGTRTYRDIIHELLRDMPWYTFGIDLCLGSPTDETVEGTDIQFLPMEMMKSFSEATKANGEPLVEETQTLYTPIEIDEDAGLTSHLTPTPVCWTLLILIIAHTLFYSTLKRDDRWFDALLFGTAGTVGMLLFFLSFISVHPCTFPNYNLLWLNPLQFVFAASLATNRLESWKKRFHLLNMGCVATAILAWCGACQQELQPGFLPLMLMLGLRSAHWVKPNFFDLGKKKSN